MLPESFKRALLDHLKKVKRIHDQDLADGWGRVLLPDALDRKYPSASRGMALAVGLSAGKPLEERKNRRRRTASRSRIDHTEGGERRREKGGTGQARHMSHLYIRSPRICWRAVTTTEPSRSFWGTRT